MPWYHQENLQYHVLGSKVNVKCRKLRRSKKGKEMESRAVF